MDPNPPPCLTRTGAIVLTVAAATALAGFVFLSAPTLTVGVSALVFLMTARWFARRHLEGFRLERDLPRRARAGESFPMEVRLFPGSRFPAGAGVCVSDPLAPSLREREANLVAGSGRILRCTGLTHQRGPLHPRPWRIASTWPLGLFRTERIGRFFDDHATLVLPKPLLPGKLDEHLERRALEGARRPFDPPEPASEFRLLREFRAGDSVKNIHWPSSLRTGRLEVAELEPPRPRPSSFAVLIHSCEAPGQVIVPEAYETVLRIATGLLLRFSREGIPVVYAELPGQPGLLQCRDAFAETLDRLALSRRIPMPLASLDSELPRLKASLRGCDDLYVLGDAPRAHWEGAFRRTFPRCVCIDSESLATGSRPELRRTRGRFRK